MTVSEREQDVTPGQIEIEIRPLGEEDLDAAHDIMRLAFGTYLGAPEPLQVFGDTDYVHTRYHADPGAAFGAELDGELVGSNFATRWGSFGFFGPLTVHPDLWDRGIASRLMEPVLELLEHWGVRQAGLFTFPQSAKHVGLYQKFGFWPQHLNPVMSRQLSGSKEDPAYTTFQKASRESSPEAILDRCRAVTDAIFPGLDVEREIRATDAQALGETVLIEEDGELAGLAVCHCGPGTEAGSGACFIKFAAVRPGDAVEQRFERLLDACESVGAASAASRIVAGVNTGRHGAYRAMLARGFRADLIGLTMLKPNEPGYNHAAAYVIDDLR
jgi:GNAT superfamily N-acetyltransferase